MKKWIHDKSQIIFFLTLAIYVGIWATVSYIGVYVTYVAGPVLFVSGVLMFLTRPKEAAREGGNAKT